MVLEKCINSDIHIIDGGRNNNIFSIKKHFEIKGG